MVGEKFGVPLWNEVVGEDIYILRVRSEDKVRIVKD
jgi:hypothetical protein